MFAAACAPRALLRLHFHPLPLTRCVMCCGVVIYVMWGYCILLTMLVVRSEELCGVWGASLNHCTQCCLYQMLGKVDTIKGVWCIDRQIVPSIHLFIHLFPSLSIHPSMVCSVCRLIFFLSIDLSIIGQMGHFVYWAYGTKCIHPTFPSS